MKKILKAATRFAMPELPMDGRAVRASAMKAGKWAMKRMGRRRGPDYGAIAVRGLGAAAITIPVGYLIGRHLMSQSTTTVAH